MNSGPATNILARGMLLELIAIAETLREGEGQLSRAKYKLSVLYGERGMQDDSEACKAHALEIRNRLKSELKDAPFVEEEFQKLCLWMLW